MKTYLLAAVMFVVPIIGVIAMNPNAAKQSLKDVQKWAVKTFPTPKPKKKFRRRRS